MPATAWKPLDPALRAQATLEEAQRGLLAPQGSPQEAKVEANPLWRLFTRGAAVVLTFVVGLYLLGFLLGLLGQRGVIFDPSNLLRNLGTTEEREVPEDPQAPEPQASSTSQRSPSDVPPVDLEVA